MRILKNTSSLLPIFVLLFFASCVTKKKYKESLSSINQYETRTRSLDMKLSKAQQDSIAMQHKIDELAWTKDSLEKKLIAKNAVVEKTNLKTRGFTPEEEYQKKAVMIYGFTKNIEWVAPYTTGDFVIGVFGSSPIYDKLKSEVEGKKAGNQIIVIKQFTTTNNLTNCHVIFVTSSNYSKIGAIKEKISKFPTLLVTEEEYMKNDSHINLLLEGRTLKYTVNKEAMTKAQLKPSSKLITMAE